MNKLAQIDFSSIAVPGAKFKADGSTTIGAIVSGTLIYIFAFAGVGLLFYLISGGFKLMTAAGDQKKMQEGQHIITNAFIGFGVIFMAFFIVQTLSTLLGLTDIGNIF